MKVKTLREALWGQPADADVEFGPEEGKRTKIEGGLLAQERRSGRHIVLLAPIPLDELIGGF